MSSGSLKSGKPLSTKPRRPSTENVQQPYSKKRRNRSQIGLQRHPRRTKAKMQIASKSRRILHSRRRRIYRGVEQPGSSSGKSHHSRNQLVLTLVQQLYSNKIANLRGI